MPCCGELLTHLDDLVVRLSQESDVGRPAGDVGATCLYAVYDPVSRRCSLAAAGHPPPVLRLPDGTVEFVELPVGPPLGVGGLPFEAVERELPAGSLLALCTDGLVEDRLRDIDVGSASLAEVLHGATGSLDEICSTVLDSLLPVAQLTERWGSRQHLTGKTIWAEQTLTP